MNRNEPGVDRDGHYSRNEPYDTVKNRNEPCDDRDGP